MYPNSTGKSKSGAKQVIYVKAPGSNSLSKYHRAQIQFTKPFGKDGTKLKPS